MIHISSSWHVIDGAVAKVRKTEGRPRARSHDAAARKQRRRDYWRRWKQAARAKAVAT